MASEGEISVQSPVADRQSGADKADLAPQPGDAVKIASRPAETLRLRRRSQRR